MKFIIKGRVASKKNSRVFNTKTKRSFPSKQYREWHEQACWQLYTQKKKTFTHCNITIEIYALNRRRFDLDNVVASIFDVLVDCGILEDDNVNVVPEFRVIYKGIDKENPRAEVTITQICQKN